MNILYLFYSLDTGGSQKISVYTAIGMKKRGHNVYVLSPEGEYSGLLREKDVRFINLNSRLQKKNLINFFYLFYVFLYYIYHFKIDIIHTDHRWFNFICYFASFFTKTKLIWTDHSLLKGKNFLTLYKDKVISVCNACKRHLIDYFRIPEDKIIVIYNSVPPFEQPTKSQIEELLKEMKIEKDARIACTISRLSEEKGHKYLLKAIPKILRYIPNAHFLLVGEGDLKNTLIQLTKNLGIINNVHFLGERKNIPVILEISDLMILPSLSEGLNISILEAFSFNVPVVTTKVGGNIELVKNGKTGYIVESKDYDALADAIVDILSYEKKRIEMGNNAKNLINKKFDFDKMISEIELTYKE